MTKNDNKDFKKATKYWVSDNLCDDGDVNGRDYCHIFGKYRSSAHIDVIIDIYVISRLN